MTKKKVVLVLIPIFCVTIVVILAIGAWSYIQYQSIQQKDRALQQQQQNLRYEQEQINQRQQFEETCKYGNPYQKFGAGC